MSNKSIRYIRLLSYNDALKVVKYINRNEFGYANISPGCVSMEVLDMHLEKVSGFIMSLNVPYSIDEEPAYITEERMISRLKENGEIQPTYQNQIK